MSKYPNLSEDIRVKLEKGEDVKTLLATLKQRVSVYEKAKSEVEELRKEIEGLNYEELKEPIRLFEKGDYEGCLKSIEKVRAILPEIKSKVKIAEELEQLINKYPHLGKDIKPELVKFKKDYNVDVQTLLNTLNQRINKYKDLKSKLSNLESNIKSVKDLTIPKEILEKIELAKNIESLEELEKTVSEIERKINEILNSKPEIKMEIPDKEISQGWNPFKVKIKNEGYAHAYDVEVSVKGDVNTMPIKPVTVKGLESRTIEIPLKPTEIGTIPLEISIKYKDGKNNEFVESSLVWVEVKGETEVKLLAEGLTPAEFTYVESEKAKPAIDFPSQLLSKYEPIELLGEGGFAKVFKCRRKDDGQIVAVKIPIESEDAGKSFVSEISNWKKLSHNNIVKLYDYNIYPHPHIEMELCDRTLCDVKLKPHEILKVAYAIADALSYAHSKGVIHGDLKPTNILFKENTPKLSDWGMGYTPAYSPPEVLRGEKPDEKADIWSFGVVLYELVKGYNPFQGMDDIETMSKVLEFEPDFSNLGVLEGIIRKCLQKERDNRFSSMDEIKRELAKINLTKFSKTFSLSKSKRDRVYSASEIISTYVCEGDFKLARDRLNTVKSLNIMPLKIADAMLAVIEIFEKCHTKVTLDFIKRKYEFILDLLKEHKEEFEKSEDIGILLRKVLLHQCNNVISDDERELIRNVFCKALLEKIKVLAYKSVE